jgi:ribonuclease P protein component
VQRLKTRAQFEAVMAGGTVSRTPHFVLHRAAIEPLPPTGPEPRKSQALFVVQDEPWVGAVVPKRHAKRAVTRNGIKRQIYAVSAAYEERLPAAAHVVRLRLEFARKEYASAWSEPLKASVRGELLQLFERAVSSGQGVPAVPAKAGIQGDSRGSVSSSPW